MGMVLLVWSLKNRLGILRVITAVLKSLLAAGTVNARPGIGVGPTSVLYDKVAVVSA
jgi:hypothetical protein